MSLSAMHSTVVWFFLVLAMNGEPVKETVGQWETRGDCEAFRQAFIIAHYRNGAKVNTTLCTRRYERHA